MRTILPAPPPHKTRTGAGQASETFGTHWPFKPFEITGLSLVVVKGRAVWKSKRRKLLRSPVLWERFKDALKWCVEVAFLLAVFAFMVWMLGATA